MLRGKTVACDFDGVIHDYKRVGWPHLGRPVKDAQSSLKKLQRLNNKIVIFSSRATSTNRKSQLAEWLHQHKIPFDDITNVKGDFDCIVDDRAIGFTNWSEANEKFKHW